MKIFKLSSDNIDAWFDFFDHRAFADHKAWKTCYCTYYFYPRFETEEKIGRSKRAYAKWLIENNRMNGYLAYLDGQAIGWCNVGPKQGFPRLVREDESCDGVKSVVCFIVEAQHRGSGVATALLTRVIADSKKDGTKIIEAYPNMRAQSQFGHYHGPLNMYLNAGFILQARGNRRVAELNLMG